MKVLLKLILIILISDNSWADIFGEDNRTSITFGDNRFPHAKSIAVGVLNSLWLKKEEPLELWIDKMSDIMCEDEKFFNETSLPYACSGFLVGPDLLITAGHCATNFQEIRNVSDGYCEVYSWLFDYQVQSNGKINTDNITQENVYRCKEILFAVADEDDSKRDFALIRLDRTVRERQPLKISFQPMRSRSEVTMLGFPMGMPMKLSNKAHIFNVNPGKDSYLTNLDAFGGNSGSPVFNSKNEVIGVLVGGNPAVSTYRDNQNKCERYNRCDNQGKNCTSLPFGTDGFPNTNSRVQKIFQYESLLKQYLN